MPTDPSRGETPVSTETEPEAAHIPAPTPRKANSRTKGGSSVVKAIALVLAVGMTLAACMILTGSAAAVEPVQSAGGGGDRPLELDPDREVCWSQGPNLDGLIASSEVIGAFGLETEIANDFLPGTSGWVVGARWWGGYYNYLPGDPLLTSFNLRFYDDSGSCLPGSLLCEYVLPHNANETFLSEQFGFPVYEYHSNAGEVCCAVVGDALYWFGAQGGDHPFPPQWGRLEAAGGVQLCDTVFKSVFFSYPDWEPADILPYDASQEFECAELCAPVATAPSTWGSIKGLFR
jgi:hypothetical protein